MTIARCLIAALCLVAVMGCGGNSIEKRAMISSAYDGDPSLSDYKTWDYAQYVGLGPFSSDRALRDRLHKVIVAELSKQGLEYKPGKPDLTLGYYLAMERVGIEEVEQVYAEFTPEFEQTLKTIDQGSMSIFIFDAKSGAQVWMASAEGEADKGQSLDKRKSNMEKLIVLLMAELPQ